MSTTRERPRATDGDETRATASAHGRRGRWSRRRVELRLAARQARRAWPASLLVITLVALPMTLISGAAVFASSRMPSPDEKVVTELGTTESWLTVVGGADPSRQQSAEDPGWYDVDRRDDGEPVNPELDPLDDPTGLVPPGTSLLEVSHASVTATTPGGLGVLDGIVGDAADPRLDGRFELLEGRRPEGDGETAVSPGALRRLEARIGDALELTEPSATLTIVGVMKAASARDAEQSVFVTGSVVPRDLREPQSTLWFAPDWQPRAEELPALNQAGVIAYARDLVRASGAGTHLDAGTAWTIAGVAMIVGGFTAYLVILLAGAGFAVSARRQERSLAVAVSVGADRGSVFRVVMLQGSVLGLTGGVLGAAAGVALAVPALALLDDGAASSLWGFHVPWWGIAGVVLFATAVGTASALVPARSATRGDVLSSLRGSRRPPRLRADRPFWGMLLGIGGVVMTAAGGLTLASLNAADPIDYGNPLRSVSLAAIVGGPILFQIGAIVAGHWLLSAIARGASRAGLAPRIAARDAAANPARIVPAFAAIAACVFIASFAMTSVAVFTTAQGRGWWYQAPLGSVVVEVFTNEDDGKTTAMARRALEQTEPTAIGVVRDNIDRYRSGDDAQADPQDPFTAELFDYTDCDSVAEGACTMRSDALLGAAYPVVIAPSDLETVLGTRIDDATRAAFAAGGALVLPSSMGESADGTYIDDGEVALHRWAREDTEAYWQDGGLERALPDPIATTRIPAQEIMLTHSLPWTVIIPPAVADEIGYRTSPSTLIGAFDEPPSPQALDRLALAASGPAGTVGGFTYRVETGPYSPAPWLWLILGAAGVLVLGAGGVALGLARVERRPDDATLAAVGAGAGVRRRIAFWQATIIVGIGSVTGTVAGLIPTWGIVMQTNLLGRSAPTMADAPWPWLALLAVGLPLVIAAGSWLIPSRRPDLTRRTVIA